MLQWSHVLTNVESAIAKAEKEWSEVASMEPRPHERGKHCVGSRLAHQNPASMEPRPHERGKRIQRKICPLATSASMEPRPHERGKTVTRWRWTSTTELQWSHVLTNVERPKTNPIIAPRGWASMEPRPHERGKFLQSSVRSYAAMLQWSHVLTNVESSAIKKSICVYCGFNGATSSRTWKD